MKREELLKHFNQKAVDEVCGEANALSVAETHYFNKPSSWDYRDEAIKHVAKRGLPFVSTCNSLFEIFKRFVKVVCPYCGGETAVTHGGGSSTHTSITYDCIACKARIVLSAENETFSAQPER